MSTDLNDIRDYAAELRAQIKARKKELSGLETDLKNTETLLRSLDAQLSKIGASRPTKTKRKMSNLERTMAVIKTGPKDGYTTRELMRAFEAQYGQEIKETTLRSSLTVLRLEKCIERDQQRWVFRKPYLKS